MSTKPTDTFAALKWMNHSQKARWYWLLRAIDEAETQRQMDQAKCLAEGYLLGLFDARVFDEAERAALHEEALTREKTSTLFDA
ncbi:hypothetical protein [Pseudomonas sp. BGI-2]|uniref:hypothetical protein n=1 Tax=Pseudomonas sp. BGI-2 TaxID=2528211 RepID=UPI001033E66E|nr:hypothetical protein [Pseudomonas sp. BGI-2]TBN35509.1 hypothetical protein EYC95_25895 [Pseudomonas sp. BGI-2]